MVSNKKGQTPGRVGKGRQVIVGPLKTLPRNIVIMRAGMTAEAMGKEADVAHDWFHAFRVALGFKLFEAAVRSATSTGTVLWCSRACQAGGRVARRLGRISAGPVPRTPGLDVRVLPVAGDDACELSLKTSQAWLGLGAG